MSPPSVPAASEQTRLTCGLLPREPGVYRFRDARDRVIYVGRATDLRSRTRSYWGDLRGRRHLRRMVAQICRVEALVCQSVHEAGWLERNLLTRSLPRWNRTRGGQEHPVWFVLDADTRHPSLAVTLTEPGPDAVAFGPYLGSTQARLARSAALRAWPVHLTGTRLDASERSIAEAREVSPLDQSLLLDRLAALLAGDPAAWDQTHTRLVLARDRAVARLAFETAAQIQDELTALGWSLAPQSVAGCSPADLRVHGWHDGLLLTLTAHVGFVDEWRTRPADESRAAPFVAETPHAWREFAARNARLAVRLRDSALHCRR